MIRATTLEKCLAIKKFVQNETESLRTETPCHKWILWTQMLTCSVEVTVLTGPSLSNVWGDVWGYPTHCSHGRYDENARDVIRVYWETRAALEKTVSEKKLSGDDTFYSWAANLAVGSGLYTSKSTTNSRNHVSCIKKTDKNKNKQKIWPSMYNTQTQTHACIHALVLYFNPYFFFFSFAVLGTKPNQYLVHTREVCCSWASAIFSSSPPPPFLAYQCECIRQKFKHPKQKGWIE